MLTISVLFILLVIDVIMFTEYDKYIASTFLFLAQLLGIWFFVPEAQALVGDGGVFHFLTTAVPVYIGIGIAVAAIKWILHTLRVAHKVKEYSKTFEITKKDPRYNVYVNFLNHIDGARSNGLRLLLKHPEIGHSNVSTKEQMITVLTPAASKCVDRITSWIFQWPIVIIALVLEDVLGKIGNWVSAIFSAVFTTFTQFLLRRATSSINVDNVDNT